MPDQDLRKKGVQSEELTRVHSNQIFGRQMIPGQFLDFDVVASVHSSPIE